VPEDLAAASLSPAVIWLDLQDPNPEEVAFAERALGLEMLSFEDLSEIEASSRLYIDNGALFMSAPLVYRGNAERPERTPVGFVLSRTHRVTVRFKPLAPFATFAQSLDRPETSYASSAAVFSGLVEAIIERAANVLKTIAGDLDALSHRLFRVAPSDGRRYRPAREQADLRHALQRVGRGGDLASQIRDALLGIARMVPFVAIHATDWMEAEIKSELETIRLDVVSLSDYDAHLLNKVQLLLDATLGLINIEQNNIIKVLTIVSVVGAADLDCQHVRDELQSDARARLVLGLSLRPRADLSQRGSADSLVQAAWLVLSPSRELLLTSLPLD
jgi:magnesium transporter